MGKASPTGVITEDPDWRPHENVRIAGNYFSNRDTEYGWDSVYLTSVRGGTVEGNIVDGAGVVGIEMYYSDDIVVQDNEVAEIESRAGAADSNGIDPDRGTSNILIQGNYIHDSGEGILLCGFGFSTAVVRYNIIKDVDKNYINPHGSSGVNVIHNNLMINTQAPARNNTIGFFDSSGSNASYLLATNPHHLYNNVFVNTRDSVGGSQFRGDFPGVTYRNNSYFGPKVVPPASDASPVTTDPQLVGDPATDIRNALIGSASSPLISAGAVVDLAQIAPGIRITGGTAEDRLPLGVDLLGSTVTAPPTIGATSYVPTAGNGLLTGIVLDQHGEAVAGSTVSVGAQTVTTSPSGRYTVETASGAHTLRPSAVGYLDGASATVDLAAGATVDTVLTLGETTATEGSLAGIVTSGGEPLAGATVTITRGGATIATATSGAGGSYRVDRLPKATDYVVSATLDGFETLVRDGVEVRAARTATVDLSLRVDDGETVYAIRETFDDEPTGTFTGTADGMLTARANAALGTITVDEAGTPSAKHLRISKTSRSSGTLSVFNPTALGLSGTVTIEARVQRTTPNQTPNQAALYTYRAADWRANDPAASTNPIATIGLSNGKIFTHNVTGANTVRNVVDHTVGQWHRVRNVADLDAGTFDLFVDDMQTPVLADQPLRTLAGGLDHLQFFMNGTHAGDLLVDDVRVNTGVPYDVDDASIGALDLTVGGAPVALTPTSETSYSATVDPFTESVRLAATPGSPFALVRIGGEDATAGAPVEVDLIEGANDDATVVTEIPVVVIAEDGTESSYTVAVERTNPNQLAQLRELAVVGHALTPAFASDRQGEQSGYGIGAELASDVSSLALTWRHGWSGQSVRINGQATPTGATGATVTLREGENVIEVAADSFAGDVGTYVLRVTRKSAPVETDRTKPTATLVAPTTAGPFRTLTVAVDASDDRGLARIVANVYRNGTLVKSTQTPVNGALTGRHTASVVLTEGGGYSVRYNAVDTAGNVSATGNLAFSIDTTAPTATVKTGAGETIGTGGVYTRVSFKLHDAGKVDRIVLNGVAKNLTDSVWSDLNAITPGVYGAKRGSNTLVVHDVAGNTSTATFTLQ